MPTRRVEPEFLERLGRIVTQWAFVEAAQAEFLAHVLHAEPGALYIMTQNVSGKTLADWIRTMVPIRLTHPNTQQRIAELLKEIDEARSERNILVHGLWSTECPKGTVMIQTVRWERAEIVKHEIVTLADLDELIKRILAIGQELNFLIKSLVKINSS